MLARLGATAIGSHDVGSVTVDWVEGWRKPRDKYWQGDRMNRQCGTGYVMRYLQMSVSLPTQPNAPRSLYKQEKDEIEFPS